MSHLNEAISYTERGWRVFPLEPGDKVPAKWLFAEGLKHGVKHATTDEDQITDWWTRHPDSNIGLATGAASGIWSVDCDEGGGLQNFLDLCKMTGIELNTLCQKTGNGHQFFFQWPEGFIVRNSAHKLGPRIDIRGEGGYCVAPPSIHPNGNRYEWLDDTVEPMATPQALIEALKGKISPRNIKRAAEGVLIDLTRVPDPPAEWESRDQAEENLILKLSVDARDKAYQSKERHPQLVWFATQLRDSRVLYERARRAMYDLCEELKTCPWNPKRLVTKQEGEGVIANAYGRPPREEHPWMQAYEDAHPETGKVVQADRLPWRLGHPLNDRGNADRFAEALRDRLIFVPSRGWMIYRLGRWADDHADLYAGEAAMQVVDLLKKELEEVEKQESGTTKEEIKAHEDRVKKFQSHMSISGQVQRIKGMLHCGRSVRGMHDREISFDFQPHIVNVGNGTLNLKNGTLQPHSPSDRLSRRCLPDWVPGSPRPRFEQFLEEIFSGDMNVVQYVQKVLGYCLTGETRERLFWMFSGLGANGKDTLMGTVMHAMGDYADRINSDIFLQSDRPNAQGPSPEKAKLKGLRLALASETPEDGKLNEAEIKSITGGDDITARRLHRDPMTFKPTHKIILLTNYKPHASGDIALWDRLRIIEFRERFDGDRRDPTLKEALAEEAQGVLDWLIQGAMAYYRDGGIGYEPTAIRDATTEYRTAEDLIRTWVDERTTPNKDARHSLKELYDDFADWAHQESDRIVSKKKFGGQLNRMGIQESKSNGIRVRVGVALNNPPVLDEGWAK